MSAQMARCRQGHIFDASGLTACPTCGEPLAEATSAAGNAASQPGPEPVPRRNITLPLIGALCIAVALAAGFAFWPRGSETTTAELHRNDRADSGASQLSTAKASEDARVKPLVSNDKPRQANEGDAGVSRPAQQQAVQEQSPPPPRPALKESEIARQDPADAVARPGPSDTKPLPQPQDVLAALRSALNVSEAALDMTVFGFLRERIRENPDGDLVALLDRLSKRGLAPASAELANLYLNGRGRVAANPGLGLDYLRKAVDQGNPNARMVLARIYNEGKLLPADRAEADALLAAAAREAVPDALTVLRNARIDPRQFGPSGPDLLAMAARGDAGVRQAADKFIADGLISGYAALAWYGAKHATDAELKGKVAIFAERAARAGLTAGFQTLAYIYAEGTLVKRNIPEAILWRSVSVKQCPNKDVCSTETAELAALKRMLSKDQIERIESVRDRIAEKHTLHPAMQ